MHIYKKLTISALLASSILYSNSVLAEETKVVSSLDTVTVVATRSPQKTFDVPGTATSIDLASPSISGATTVSEIFRDTAGVNFFGTSRRNGLTPVIRGFDNDSVLVMFDGVRQNFQSQHDGRFFIDPEMLKSVEVVKGPGSSLYGSSAVGGTIAFKTLDAADLLEKGQKVGAKVTAGYQDASSEKSTSATVYGREGNVDAIANLVFKNSDNIELGDSTELIADDRMLSGMAKVNISVDDFQTLKFSFTGYDNDSKEPNNPQIGPQDPRASNELVDKNIKSYTTSIGYEYSDPSNDLVNLKTKVYYTDTEVAEDILVRTQINNVGDKLSRKVETYGFTADNQSFLNKNSDVAHTFSYGFEYYKDEQDGDQNGSNFGRIPDAEADYYGFYLQDEIKIKNIGVPGEFLVVPGARYDSYSSDSKTGLGTNDDNQLSPRLGVTYKPVPEFMVFANYSEAFRAANLTELYSTGTHFSIANFRNTFVPSPNLKPEEIQNFEYGFGYNEKSVFEKNDNVMFKVSRFDIDGTNFIDAEVFGINLPPSCFGPGAGPTCTAGNTRSINVPNAELHGYDATAGYENSRLLTSLSYSYVTGKNEDTGRYIFNTTPATIVTNIGVKLPEVDSIAGIRSTFADEHNKVNDPIDARDGYAVHDVYYQWTPTEKDMQNFTLGLGVDNIFDKKYTRVFAGAVEEGRNIKAKVTYKW